MVRLGGTVAGAKAGAREGTGRFHSMGTALECGKLASAPGLDGGAGRATMMRVDFTLGRRPWKWLTW